MPSLGKTSAVCLGKSFFPHYPRSLYLWDHSSVRNWVEWVHTRNRDWGFMEPARKRENSWGQARGELGWHKWLAMLVGRSHRTAPWKNIKWSINIIDYSDWQKAGRMSLFVFACTFLYLSFKFGLDMKSILHCPTAVPHMLLFRCRS